MADFNADTATKSELAKWYEDTIGYNPFEDDPTISVDEVRQIVKDYIRDYMVN